MRVGKQPVYVVLLEGKTSKNKGTCQVWDDLTKIGQELKVALDSILRLEPEDDVCVIGILVRGKDCVVIEKSYVNLIVINDVRLFCIQITSPCLPFF